MSKLDSTCISLHDENWLQRQRNAGKCVSHILQQLRHYAVDAIGSCSLDLEQTVLQIFKEYDCQPTFLGYKGFPNSICISVNNELVHGIPSSKKLIEGDVIKFDLGATYNSAIADAAITTVVGKPHIGKYDHLISTCKLALSNAIESIKIDKQLGCIGNAIHHTVKNTRYGLVVNYGGHGLDENVPHASPFVCNKSSANEGPRLQAGMSLAIEPMLTIGDNRTRLSSDGWTVLTNDIGVHFEHTIYVHSDNTVEIITK